jgi:hypothetical protein
MRPKPPAIAKVLRVSPLLPDADKPADPLPRAALEAHAASQGHKSIEACLSALQPQQLDAPALLLVLKTLPELAPSESVAAADLFFGFTADPLKDWSVFHPSLLKEDALHYSDSPNDLMPCYVSQWLGCESR